MSEWEGDCSLLETLTEEVSIQLQTDTQMIDVTRATDMSPKKADNSAHSSRALSEDGQLEYDIETTCECEPRYQEILAEKDREIDHWKEKYTNLLASLDGVLTSMEVIQNRYSVQQSEFAEEKAMLIQEINDAKSLCTELEDKLSNFEQEEVKVSSGSKSLETEISKLKSELSASQNAIKAAQKDLELERVQVKELKSQLERQSKSLHSSEVVSTPVSQHQVQEAPIIFKTVEPSDASTTEQSSLGSLGSQGSQQYWRKVNTHTDPGETGQKARNNRMRNLSSNIFTLEEKETILETPLKKSAAVQEESQTKSITTPRTSTIQTSSVEEQPVSAARGRCNRRNPQADFSPVPTLEEQVSSARARSPIKIDSPNDVPGIELIISKVTGEKDSLMEKLKQLEAIRPRTGDILRQRGKINDEIDVVNSQLDSLKSKIRRIYSHK